MDIKKLNTPEYETVDAAIEKLFYLKNQSYVEALTPHLIECNQTHQYDIIHNISHHQILPYDEGRWSILEYNHAEQKIDYFDSRNSCFANVGNSDKEKTLSLITCKLTADNACKTRVCVPFCCGTIHVYTKYANDTEESECHFPKERITIPKLIERNLLNLRVLEDGKEVSIAHSSTSPYYFPKNVNETCHTKEESKYQYHDITSDYPYLVYRKTFNEYQLQLNDILLTPNEYCISQYDITCQINVHFQSYSLYVQYLPIL